MAAVLQRGKKKAWYAVYRDLNGRQRWSRVKEASDRKGAQAAADLLEATAQKRKTAQHLRKAFSDLYREFYGQSMPTTTVRAYAQGWLAQKKPEAADSTYQAYDQGTSWRIQQRTWKRSAIGQTNGAGRLPSRKSARFSLSLIPNGKA
jgi:hypothetical protein